MIKESPFFNDTRVWTIAGGSGGCGKSLISSIIASSLAKMNKKVLLIDADPEGSQFYQGLTDTSETSAFCDFLENPQTPLTDLVTQTELQGVCILPQASEIAAALSPNSTHHGRLTHEINALQHDYILIDLGAVVTLQSLDLFLCGATRILVSTPEPNCVQSAYGFLKLSLQRLLFKSFADDEVALPLIQRMDSPDPQTKIETISQLIELTTQVDREKAAAIRRLRELFHCTFILNKVSKEPQLKMIQAFKTVSKKFLGMDIFSAGHFDFFECLSSQKAKLSLSAFPKPETTEEKQIQAVVLNLLKFESLHENETENPAALSEMGSIHEKLKKLGSGSKDMIMGLNDKLTIAGSIYHVQTEDLGHSQATILTLVYKGGQILHSQRFDYRDHLKQSTLDAFIMEKIEHQHLEMIKSIYSGTLDKAPK